MFSTGKKSIYLFFIISTIILFNSCKDSGSPDSITSLFLISLNKLDFTTANSISTSNTKSLLKIMSSATENIQESEKARRSNNFKLKITNSKLLNDSVAIVEFTTEPQLLPFNELRLIKVRGKMDRTDWKVDISTLDLMEAQEILSDSTNKSPNNDGQFHEDADSTPAIE